MNVVGFTFIRNAIKYDYPVVEAIKSVLPLCNAFVVAVGNSDDDTLGLIKRIASDKIKIIETVWDDSLRHNGAVLAKETDKAFRAIQADADWCFYIQGDEVIHEQYLPVISEAMQKWKDHKGVDGLLLNYLHFYGSYDYVGASTRWYRKEVRIIRKLPDIYSYRDAQGFRKGNNEKLRVKPVNAYMYHYGWVRKPEAMQAKLANSSQYYHDDQWIEKNIAKVKDFDYSQINALWKFEGTHPLLMRERIERTNWAFDHDPSKNVFTWKDRFKTAVYKVFGYMPFEYRNYRVV